MKLADISQSAHYGVAASWREFELALTLGKRQTSPTIGSLKLHVAHQPLEVVVQAVHVS